MAKVKRNIQNAYNEPFACRLRALLEENNISQSELAAEIGVTRQAISNYTLGNTVPNADVLVRLSKKYNVSVDYLLGLAKTPVTDKDINYICEYTGLSFQSVDRLHNTRDKEYNKEINFILDDSVFFTCFSRLCDDINLYRERYNVLVDTYTKYVENEKEENAELLEDDLLIALDNKELYEFRTQRSFQRLLDKYIGDLEEKYDKISYTIQELSKKQVLSERELEDNGND